MLAFLASLLWWRRAKPVARTKSEPLVAKARDPGLQRTIDLHEPAPALPRSASPSPSPSSSTSANTGATTESRRHAEGLNLDAEEHLEVVLVDWEENLLFKLESKIKQGDFELPLLPSASMSVIDMAAHPSVEIRDLITLLESDPTLSSELMRTANSALFATTNSCDTINQAVLRMGLRNLRSMVLAISMRGIILRAKSLTHVAEEVWRQAYSMGLIARAIAKPLGLDPDRAFMIGLLHDLGKLPLLGLLEKHMPKGKGVTPALIGRVFSRYHEAAGKAAALAWKLNPELVEIAGCHHRYAEHPSDPRGAAFASLVHKLDLYLSLDHANEYFQLHGAPELEFLGVAPEKRHEVLRLAREVFEAAQEPEQAVVA